MTTLGWKEELVKDSLYKFVQKHIGNVPWSTVDDIVLNYMVSILEEQEEDFDVNYFVEMMSPFFPELVDVNSDLLSIWGQDLAARLAQHEPLGKDDFQSNAQNKHVFNKTEFSNATVVNIERKPLDLTEEEEEEEEEEESLDNSLSPLNDDEEVDDPNVDEDNDQIKLLQEMFPLACTLELQHCLCIAEGNTEKAAQLILHRQEMGENIVALPRPAQKAVHKKEQNDNELRQHILSRYMYVDQSEDKKEHKPVAPKWEPKKLIRYRNNQIVSIKGEKYTEVKEAESEEMKKTYVTLKPSKQYRFH